MPKATLLLTGGLGYIGSHTAVALAAAGYDFVILDNGSNASVGVLQGLQKIIGISPEFIRADVRDAQVLRDLFAHRKFEGIIHFAGLKSVGESCEKPAEYWDNNVIGSLTLVREALNAGIKKIVFSSSATVYDASNISPLREDAKLGTSNPYGTTKLVVEKLLEDFARSQGLQVVSLRYFNPIGAHESGWIGEKPSGIPANLFPYVMDVATGKREKVSIFGDDWPTPDGTGVRDYIHVMDLAEGHIAAWEALSSGKLKTHQDFETSCNNESRRGTNVASSCNQEGLFFACNLGTGCGTSVRELIEVSREVTGHLIPAIITSRRPGDVAAVWANVSLAQTIFGWTAKRKLRQAVEDGWRFKSQQT